MGIAIMSDPVTQTPEAQPLGYLDYRCPHCKSDRCGNDANAGWDVVTQQSTLLDEFDSQWCSDCGDDVTLEAFTVTDPEEIARIDAERAKLRIVAAGPQLYEAAVLLVRSLSARRDGLPIDQLEALIKLSDAIQLAEGGHHVD
jgi:hypothetical protein